MKDHSPNTAGHWIREAVASRKPEFSLEQEFYTHPEIFELDVQRIFHRFWLLAGHVSQIPNEGDYFLYHVANESMIIIRGKNSEVNALYNVCRHRGSRVLLEKTGRARHLVCPYHGWAYATDGALTGCMHMPESFDKTQYGLRRAHVRVTCGLIYISLAEKPLDFEPFDRDLTAHLRLYHLDQAKIAHHESYPVACNWKLLCENFCECYHCGTAHPEYTGKVMTAAVTASPSLQALSDQVEAQGRDHFAKMGLDTRTIGMGKGGWYWMARYAFRPGFVSQTKDGKSAAPLFGELKNPDAGVFSFFTWPNAVIDASADHAALVQLTPLSATQSRADVYWLVRNDAVKGKDYDHDHLTWLWKITGEQDMTLCLNNQAGVNSSCYSPGPYSEAEQNVEGFVCWYLKQVMDESPGATFSGGKS